MDEDDEELWPPFYRAARTRQADRERRIHEHVQRHIARNHGGRPRGRDRGRALSREQIVRAAIDVADAEGADAISMRRIARELNAGTMSLYWHVSSKEELLDLMLDAIDGEMEVPEPSGDWRADLRAIARGIRTGLLRHRWVMDFMGG